MPCLPLPNYHIHAPYTTCQEHCLLYCGNSSRIHLLIHHSSDLTTVCSLFQISSRPQIRHIHTSSISHSVTFIHIILPSNPERFQPLRDFSVPVMSVTAVCFPALPQRHTPWYRVSLPSRFICGINACSLWLSTAVTLLSVLCFFHSACLPEQTG